MKCRDYFNVAGYVARRNWKSLVIVTIAMICVATKHLMLDHNNKVINATVLTCNFDYKTKSRQVTDANMAFIMPSAYTEYASNYNVDRNVFVSLEVHVRPIVTHEVLFKSFNAGRKWYNNNLVKLNQRYNNTLVSQEGFEKSDWATVQSKVISYQFSVMSSSSVVVDLIGKLLAIFGGLLMFALILSLFNAMAIYGKSKEPSYINLHKLGCNDKTIKSFRRIDILSACLRGVMFGGVIFATIAAVMLACTVSVLKLAMTLASHDILIMVSMAVGVFVVMSAGVVALLLATAALQRRGRGKPAKR